MPSALAILSFARLCLWKSENTSFWNWSYHHYTDDYDNDSNGHYDDESFDLGVICSLSLTCSWPPPSSKPKKGKIQWILIWHKSEQVQPHCSKNLANFLHTSFAFLLSISRTFGFHKLRINSEYKLILQYQRRKL